jgi:hypothetical protein
MWLNDTNFQSAQWYNESNQSNQVTNGHTEDKIPEKGQRPEEPGIHSDPWFASFT